MLTCRRRQWSADLFSLGEVLYIVFFTILALVAPAAALRRRVACGKRPAPGVAAFLDRHGGDRAAAAVIGPPRR